MIGRSRRALPCSECGPDATSAHRAPVNLHHVGRQFETAQRFGESRVHAQRLRYALRGGVVKLVAVHDDVTSATTRNRVVSDTDLVTGERKVTSSSPQHGARTSTVHIRIKPIALADVDYRDPLGAAG